MPTIKKDDLPKEVVDYIDQLEAYAEGVEGENTELTERLEAVETAKAELEAMVTVGKIEKGEDPLAEVLAKADPAVRAVLEKQAQELKDQREVIEKAAAAQFDATMVSKAAALPKITTPKEELTETLKSVYKVDSELGDKVFKLLQDANTQVATASIFDEFGKSGGETTIAASVESLAEELRKGDPTMTREAAIAKAYEVNPALYNESLKGD